MSNSNIHAPQRRSQRGSALLLGLLLLVVMTLLAVFASSTGIMQERMSGNYRDAARAFEAAENATRWAEFWIYSLNTPGERAIASPCDSSCGSGDIIRTVGNYPHTTEQEGASWWASNAMMYGDDPGTTSNQESLRAISGAHEQPNFVIEHVGFVPDDFGSTGPRTGLNFYRVTARGVGGQPENVAFTRSTIVYRFE